MSCLNASFPKCQRLLKKKDFNQVKSKSNHFYGKWVKIRYSSTHPNRRLGLVIYKSYGNAIIRSMLKRRSRYIFRTMKSKLPENISLIISPQKDVKAIQYQELLLDFNHFITRLHEKS